MTEKLKAVYSRCETFVSRVVDGGMTIVETAFGTVKSYISTPKGFLLTSLGLLVVYDIYRKGQEGIINFVVHTSVTLVKDLGAIVSTAGWPIVVVALLVVMILEKRKA